MPCKGTGASPTGYSLSSQLISRHCATGRDGVLSKTITAPLVEIPEVMREFVLDENHVYLVLDCAPACAARFALTLARYWLEKVSYVASGGVSRTPTFDGSDDLRLHAQELNGAVGFYRGRGTRGIFDIGWFHKDFVAFAMYLGAGVVLRDYIGGFTPSEDADDHEWEKVFRVVVKPHGEIDTEHPGK